jgi:hypothetical protein
MNGKYLFVQLLVHSQYLKLALVVLANQGDKLAVW